EMLTPELATIAAAIQCWMGGETGCNVYCSFGGHQGFQSHFDPQDVFALQIDGTKTWRIYEGRFDQTVNVEGYRTNSFSDSHHEQARGAVRMEVQMTPGDVLYIPRGQYHDALATSDASLHLTYGVERLSGFHLLNTVTESLSRDPVVSGKLPRFDDTEAHQEHLARLADHVYAIMVQPETSRAIRAQQRARTFNYCYPTYALPKRIPAMLFRVRSFRTKLLRRGPAWWLERPIGGTEVSADEATLIEWMLNRDYFSADEILDGCGGMDTSILTAAIERFAAIELIEEI
ncbi:MAG: JmjC domain-containing protein, partial [Methyloligellaceae bacterium]